MIDVILITVLAATFYGGFKAGNSFKTIADMLSAGIDKLKS